MTLTPALLGFAGPVYAVGAAALGALFLAGAIRVRTARDDASARRLFGFSIVYLFSIFALLVVDGSTGLPG